MKCSQLPQVLYENGKTYFLLSRKLSGDKIINGWWCFQYSEYADENYYSCSFPPEATDGNSIYYLIACAPSKKEAEKDLLERVNKMTKILTEKDKKEILKKWEDKKKKFKKK